MLEHRRRDDSELSFGIIAKVLIAKEDHAINEMAKRYSLYILLVKHTECFQASGGDTYVISIKFANVEFHDVVLESLNIFKALVLKSINDEFEKTSPLCLSVGMALRVSIQPTSHDQLS